MPSGRPALDGEPSPTPSDDSQQEPVALSGDALVLQHASLVKRIAYHLLGRLPPTVDVEDLIQAGMIGLLEAARNYSSEGGANFTTFAGIRIRGAMLDEVRKVDWAPRPLWRQLRQMSRVISEMEHEQGRDVSDREVADRMEIPLDDYHRLLRDAACARVASLDSMINDDPPLAQAILEDHDGPLQHLQESTFVAVLTQEIERLPERERLVMALYYDDELNLREIGEVLGVTESRVSQIHKQAKVRLRTRLTEWVSDSP
ncbi:MAG: RNA polymerase sigma factor FliA [Pseudomonadota bacterium]